MLRVLVVSNIPTPNNDALFGQLANLAGIELTVAYCAWTERNRSWKLPAVKHYGYVVLKGWSVGRSGHLNPQVTDLIASTQPDVVILSGSYTVPTIQLAARRLRARGIPWVYWGEELGHGGGPFRRAIRRSLLWPVRCANGVFAIGSRAVESYAQAGVARQRIADFRYYPDFHNFQLAPEARQDARASVRSALRVTTDATVFIFCGRLIHLKGIDTLLHAQAALQRKNVPCTTLIVGDGKERHEIERLATSLNLVEGTRFVGFVQPADLPRYLVAADALVLPSRRDGWGLVVPEAMAAGLPVIASDQVNAAIDLIEPGRSGYLFPAENASALEAAMCSLCQSPTLLAEMAKRARSAVEREHPAPAAARMRTLLHSVVDGGAIHEL